MVAMCRMANREAVKAANAARRAESGRVVLEACRRLQGVRELTAAVLAEETGYGLDTCRHRRDELATAGLIERTWRDLSARGGRRDLGRTSKDALVIRARTAKVREAKRRIGGGPVPMSLLVQILPA
jgi:hypothetical protein